MKKRRFHINGEYYDIPDIEVSAFISDNPRAEEVRNYNIKGTQYNIPIKEVEAFETDMGFDDNIQKAKLEKKNQSLSVSVNGQLKESVPTTLQSELPESNVPNPFDIKSLLPKKVDNSEQPLMFDISEQKYTVDNNFGFDDKQIAKEQKSVSENTKEVTTKLYQQATDPTINTPEIRKEKERVRKINTEKALDNATSKDLKIKGINAQPGSAQYNEQKGKFMAALVTGDATIAADKDGNIGLKRTTGFWENAKNGWNEAILSSAEAQEFRNMTDEQRVEYANQNPEKSKPSPYIGERPSMLGSTGGFIGGAAPFLGKVALAGALSYGTGGVAAPTALAFLLTTPEMIDHGIQREVLDRYYILGNQHPEWTDLQRMQEARKGELTAGIGAIATNALFMKGMKNPVSAEGKGVVAQAIKNVIKPAIHMGAVTAGVTIAEQEIGKVEGIDRSQSEIFKNSIKSFEENGTTGFLLNTMMHMPNMVKSAYKWAMLKSENLETIRSTVEANEKAGIVPEGTTEKVMKDIEGYATVLNEVPIGLKAEVEASVAGLLQKRGNLVSEAETKSKSPAIQQIYKDKIEAVDSQIADIQRTGKPFEHEIDEVTGETYQKPTFDNIAAMRVKNLADKISKGKEITDAEDLQTQQNFPEELGKQLNRIAKEEKSANKDKEKPNTDLTDNINDYLGKNAKETEKAKAEIEPTEEKLPTVVSDNKDFTSEGGNKVVDEKGEPILVYRGQHGETKGMQSRLGSISFGSKKAAEIYANSPNNKTLDKNALKPEVIPTFIKIKNPVINNSTDPFIDVNVIIDILGKEKAQEIAEKYSKEIMQTDNWDKNFSEYGSVKELLSKKPEALSDLYLLAHNVFDDPSIVKLFKDKGYDGAIHSGYGQNSGEPEYKVFSQNQIEVQNKSTTRLVPRTESNSSLEEIGDVRTSIGDNLKSNGFVVSNKGGYDKDGINIAFKKNSTLGIDKHGDPFFVDSPNSKDVVLQEIKVVNESERGKGNATKVLKEFLNAADENGSTIYLEPEPIKRVKTENDLSRQQLIKWYEKNGFEKKNESIWVRKPQEKSESKSITNKELIPEVSDKKNKGVEPPPIGEGLYKAKNEEGRAYKIAQGFIWNGEEWIHPDYPGKSTFSSDVPAPKKEDVIRELAKIRGEKTEVQKEEIISETKFNEGDIVKFKQPAIVYKEGKPVTIESTKAGTIKSIKSNGDLEIKTQEGGYVTLKQNEIISESKSKELIPERTDTEIKKLTREPIPIEQIDAKVEIKDFETGKTKRVLAIDARSELRQRLKDIEKIIKCI